MHIFPHIYSSKDDKAEAFINRNLLIGSSVSMGGVAIWCMHFIANCAIVLYNREPALQIVYNKTFTAISFFVPIAVLLGAFMLIGTNETVSLVRLIPGGTLAGLAICGMHYLGQAGIANYTSVYDIGRVVGAAIIAVVASITALSLFFVFQASWTTSWWKRAVCASILAGAVSGMHWTASSGTNYRFKKQDHSLRQPLTRNQTVIIVLVFVCFHG
jgi:NO-binding membrane sensor protein with MHYT domain